MQIQNKSVALSSRMVEDLDAHGVYVEDPTDTKEGRRAVWAGLTIGDVAYTTLHGADVSFATFVGKCRGLQLDYAVAEFASFHKVELCRASFMEANLYGARFEHIAAADSDWRSADLRFARFHLSCLHRGNFCDADLRWASFNGCDLRGCNFDGADLTGADLRATRYDEATWHGAINAVRHDTRRVEVCYWPDPGEDPEVDAAIAERDAAAADASRRARSNQIAYSRAAEWNGDGAPSFADICVPF